MFDKGISSLKAVNTPGDLSIVNLELGWPDVRTFDTEYWSGEDEPEPSFPRAPRVVQPCLFCSPTLADNIQ